MILRIRVDRFARDLCNPLVVSDFMRPEALDKVKGQA